MRKLLEQCAVFVMQHREQLARITRRAREQDHMMRALDDIDRVELYEAEPTDKAEHIVMGQEMRGTFVQRVLVEKQFSGVTVRNGKPGHGTDAGKRAGWNR